MSEITPPTAVGSADDTVGGLPVIYEDSYLIVVDKPSGLLSQPGRTVDDSVVVRVRAARPDATGPMMMHRLDMDTSGLLVLAKDAESHRHLSMQFERRDIGKVYRARLAGPSSGLGGRIALPLRLDVDNRPMQIVCLDQGRPAVTVWQHAARRDHNEVIFYPLSGRTHQLRVHAADPRGLGVPIIGDRLYGEAGERLMLHAERLSFIHPHSGSRLTLTARVPFDHDDRPRA